MRLPTGRCERIGRIECGCGANLNDSYGTSSRTTTGEMSADEVTNLKAELMK